MLVARALLSLLAMAFVGLGQKIPIVENLENELVSFLSVFACERAQVSNDGVWMGSKPWDSNTDRRVSNIHCLLAMV